MLKIISHITCFLVLIICNVNNVTYAGDISSGKFKLHVGDFNNDNRDDVLYQAKSAVNENGIILGNGAGGFNETLQTWMNGHLGINWDTSSHNIKVIDYNGDGFADVLLQAINSAQSNYIVRADTQGKLGSLNTVVESWGNGYLGFNWDTGNTKITIGKRQVIPLVSSPKIFLQGKRDTDKFGIAFFGEGGGLVSQEWTEGYLGLQWSGLSHSAYMGDFNGDGYDDIFLQGKYQFIPILMDEITIPIRITPKTYHAIVPPCVRIVVALLENITQGRKRVDYENVFRRT